MRCTLLSDALPTLVDRLEDNARDDGDRVALIDGAHSVTYGELASRARRLAGVLHAAGVRPGDRVIHLGRDSHVVYELLYACAFTQAVLVPVNWRLSSEEIAYIVSHSAPAYIVVDEVGRVSARAVPVLTVPELVQAYQQAEPWLHAASTGPDTPIVQMYTSGTTGMPKGVVLAHRTFSAVRRLLDDAGLDWITWRSSDRNLLALASFHIGGMWWAAQAFNAGATNIVLPSFTPGAALSAIREHGVTTTCMAPAMLLMLLSEPGMSRSDCATLRSVVYGGSPISPDLLRRAMLTFDCDFAQIYGLTETGNTAVCLPPAAHREAQPPLHAAGRPYPGVQIEVRTEEGEILHQGQSGEIYIKSPARMVEYFGNPEATGQTLVDGWIRTGDAGYVDDQGYLVIHDRVKDLIIVAGENIYPAEVEKVINSVPGVHDSAVVGMPDDRWGESVVAYVVAENSALTARDIARGLSGRLAAFKVPAKYEFIDSIPRNVSGKILRRHLRDQLWAGRERSVN